MQLRKSVLVDRKTAFAMASDCDAAIATLYRQCNDIITNQSGWDSVTLAVYDLLNHIEKFDYEFSCLVIFLDCIHKWTNLEERLHLGSLVRNVEATIQKIGRKLDTKLLLKRSELSGFPISIILKKVGDLYLQRKVSELNDVFTDLMNEVTDLKMEIRRAYVSLSLAFLSFDLRYDFHWRSNFDEFVKNYSRSCKGQARFDRCIPGEECKFLNDHLLKSKVFLDHVASSPFRYVKIADFMIRVGKVAISAALRLCMMWAVKEEDRVNVRFSLLHLHRTMGQRYSLLGHLQKMDLANLEFLDLNLELLKEDRNGLHCLEDAFFKGYRFLLSSQQSSGSHYYFINMVDAFHQELNLLIKSVIRVIRDEARDVQRYLADVKSVLTKVPRLYSNQNDDSFSFESILLNLLQEIWLIKIEIFLRGQLHTNPIFHMPVNERIKSLARELSDLNYEKWLESLKLNTQFQHSRMEDIKKVKHISTLLGKVAASFHHSIYAEEIIIEEEMVRIELRRLISMIVLFKADSLFINFHNSQIVMVFDKNQMESLQKGLHFLIMFVEDQSVVAIEEAKVVFEQIEEVAGVVTSLFRPLATNKIKEEAMKILLSDVLEKIRHIMLELKNFYLHALRINFPKASGMGFIDSLLEKLRELQKADSKASLNHQIEEILENLEVLAHFLRNILEQDIQSQEIKDLGARIVDVAYEAEYYIDWTMVEDTLNWQNSLGLYHLLDDMRDLKSSVTTVYDKTQHAKAHIKLQTSLQKDPKASPSIIGDIVVVLNDQEKLIIDRLIGGTPKLDLVPIVGMPGIGKTTLAWRVYNNPSVVHHFHIRAWCCVSEIYRKREALLEILSHIMPLTDESLIGMTDEDLENKLRILLLNNKYLVFLDDMWNSEALDDLRNSLPINGNGSRILITSRNHSVASTANPHSLRQLSDAESWNLFQKKLFHNELFPVELREIGEQITKSCKGLPLAIVTVAGLLQKKERKYSSWKEIAEDLSSRVVDDRNEHCRQILELSYKHLPYYLRACFLYFGAFLEDQDVPARKLMQLWIAEGFVQKTRSKSLEDVAEDYLMDLIDRSLVFFIQPRSRGGVKACRVHDVLRQLCITKAKEDRFLQVITTRSDESRIPLHDFDYISSASSNSPLSSVTYEDYRLCYCSKRKHLIETRPSGTHVRSLLCFAIGDKDPKCPYDISFISHNFRFLRVLDLECINMGTSFPSGIELMVHLRYLAVAGYIDSVPSSIANLCNLETFVVKGMKEIVILSNSIWSLKKLRHLYVTDIAVISLQDEQQGNSSGLDSLVTLSSLFLRFGEDTDHILRQFLNIKKLKCIFFKSSRVSCNQFPRLEALDKLESLKISFYGQTVHPGEFSFPLNLKKLTLSNFRLPWNKISVIGKLPNLEVLKLLNRAFDGESWDTVEGEFSELKYLKLDTLNIVNWNAYCDHLPNLQHLVLRCCKHLKEVPSSFGEKPTLEMINVQWCGDDVEESINQILEDGDGKLKVLINFAEKD